MKQQGKLSESEYSGWAVKQSKQDGVYEAAMHLAEAWLRKTCSLQR